jgi:two-component system KDP operon response regulator KdpE
VKPHPKALIVEDDSATRRLVRIILENENYRVLEAGDGGSGSRVAAERRPDVVILDLGLPDMSDNKWLESFREWNQTPVLVLSARDRAADKVAALDAGANDYLVKPFDSCELLARLRVLQRPIPGTPEGPFSIEGNLKVNLTTHEVTLHGRRLRFAAMEEAIFHLLARYAGKVVTCEHLVRALWGTAAENKLHELQVLSARVRQKLEADKERIMIRTVDRIGYQLVFESTPQANIAVKESCGLNAAVA